MRSRKGSMAGVAGVAGVAGAVVAGVLACAALGGSLAHADSAQKISTSLVATSVAPRARGRAQVSMRGASTGRLVVVARRLAPNARFDVVLGGVKVAELSTNGGGKGKLRLRSRPHGRDQLLGFDPRGNDIVVRDHHGRDCLVGSIPGGDDSATGACCFTAASAVEPCQTLTATACMAAGGTPSTATSCLPNPCAPTPPPDSVVCCVAASANGAHLDDDDDDDGDEDGDEHGHGHCARHGDRHCDDHCEVRCESVTVETCSAHGGKVVAAPSCDPNPCRPVPPAEQVACCVPEHEDGDGDRHEHEDESEVECRHLTPERCAALGGSAAGAFCDPDPCGDDHHDGDDDDGDDDHHGDGHGGDGHHEDDHHDNGHGGHGDGGHGHHGHD